MKTLKNILIKFTLIRMQSINERWIEECTTPTSRPPLSKTVSLSTSTENLSSILKGILRNNHIPNLRVDEIGCTEKEYSETE